MQPTKLKKDSIIEAVCEFQFESTIPYEIFTGRLSDSELLRDFASVRLPIAEIPAHVRSADPNLKFQALFQFQKTGDPFIVKLGSNVISFHVVGAQKYVGWDIFEQKLGEMTKEFFRCVTGAQISRFGFRYTNSLNPQDHLISSIGDLNIELSAGGSRITKDFNLNYVIDGGESHQTIVKVATPNFVKGNLNGSVVVLDIDVQSKKITEQHTIESTIEWIKKAHSLEKDAFFSLIPEDIITKLKEE